MRPWQAWTVTICAILICIVQLYQGLCLAMFNYQMSELVDGFAKPNKQGGQASDTDWDAAIDRAKKPAPWESLVPEKPKARATYNPPR